MKIIFQKNAFLFFSTKFEDFPAEIFHLIFDYLSGDNVLKTFLYLNHRFNSIIKNLHLNTIDLSNLTFREITDLFKKSFFYISTYPHSLKLTNHLSNTNSCSGNIEFIFSSLIDSTQLKYLLNNLEQLIFIRPIINSFICLPDILLQSFIIYSLNDKIIFQKKISRNLSSDVMICSHETIRTLLVDNYQTFIYYQNPLINQIIPLIEHLKFYIDNYNQQWIFMSSFMNNTISELTIIISDNKFEYYNGEIFSSLLSNLTKTCRLHFYLELIPFGILSREDIHVLSQSFRTEFYSARQLTVTITYSRNHHTMNDLPLIIYTSPFCASKLTLIANQETVGVCVSLSNKFFFQKFCFVFKTDYTNLTRLVLDSCFSNYTHIFTPNNQNLLPNLTSLEFFPRSSKYINHMAITVNNLFRHISSRIRHIHLHNVQRTSYLIKNVLPLCTFPQLRYLDITDNDEHCSILCDILREEKFCANIFHLNITGLCRLKVYHIKDIHMKFTNLQTLTFSMKLDSSFTEQLDTIGQFILINMRSHLHYVHIYFEQENLLIMSMTPSESQLGEWLGYKQKRLLHVQAIELTRTELMAWM